MISDISYHPIAGVRTCIVRHVQIIFPTLSLKVTDCSAIQCHLMLLPIFHDAFQKRLNKMEKTLIGKTVSLYHVKMKIGINVKSRMITHYHNYVVTSTCLKGVINK